MHTAFAKRIGIILLIGCTGCGLVGCDLGGNRVSINGSNNSVSTFVNGTHGISDIHVSGRTDEVDLQVLNQSGDLSVGRGANENTVHFDTGGDSMNLQTSTEGRKLSISLKNTSTPSNKITTVELPGNLPLSLELMGGKGNYSLDFAGLNLKKISIGDRVGNVNLHLPATGCSSVDIRGTSGSVQIEVPSATSVELRTAVGVQAKVPPQITEVSSGVFHSMAYTAISPTCAIQVGPQVAAVVVKIAE